MDDIKDVKKDHITRFLGNRTLRIQPFGSNISAERAYERAERIVAAVHLVTNHVSDSEPAQRFSRSTSIQLLSSMLMLGDEMRSPESVALKKVRVVMRKLISLIRILSVAGHISQQNAETLIEAVDELGNFLLVSQRTELSEDIAFHKDEFLDTTYKSAHTVSDRQIRKGRSVSIKDRRIGGSAVSNEGSGTRPRSERIVAVLMNQGQLGIKDIATSLPEYSEKMIQRELKGLVSAGRVKKLGSKRWSMYTVVSHIGTSIE